MMEPLPPPRDDAPPSPLRRPREREEVPCTPLPTASALATSERRQLLAKRLHEQRTQAVLHLHTSQSPHYIDNAFSLVTGNMAIVSLVLGGVYMARPCAKPLAGFLVVLGLLAPFAACLPILIRQWFYLHLRIQNVVTLVLLTASVVYIVWLLLGQQWAFACSSANCDADLSTATNAVVFVLFAVLLLYGAKVVWYLALRVRYKYKQLCLSCVRDPYPNALALSDVELAIVESQYDDEDEELHDRGDEEDKTPRRNKKTKKTNKNKSGGKNRLLMDMQRHQHEIRQSLHRLWTKPTTGDKVRSLTK